MAAVASAATATTTAGVKIIQSLTDTHAKYKSWCHARIQNPATLMYVRDHLQYLVVDFGSIDEWLRGQSGPASGHPKYQLACNRLEKCRATGFALLENCNMVQGDIEKHSSAVNQSDIKDDLTFILDQTDKLDSEVQTLVGYLESLDDLSRPLRAGPETHKDEFVAVRSMVPSPLCEVYMDFCSRDEEGKPATSEGKLKHAIMDASSGCTVGAIARGQAGVGKTCALLTIGRLPEIHQLFTGGVLYMPMGAEAGLENLIENLARIVDISGGEWMAKRIRYEAIGRLDLAVDFASSWFLGRTCLFLIDDLWQTKGISPSILKELSRLVGSGCSRIVYTTRDRDFEGKDHVIFEAGTNRGIQAREILRLTSGLPWPQTDDSKVAFERILDQCAGLQLLLSLSGGAVRALAEGPCEQNQDGAWQRFLVLKPIDRIVEAKEKIEKQIEFSLSLLDQGDDGLCRQQFLSLCVLRKQQRVRASILKRIWGLEEASEADRAMSKLERLCILRTSVIAEESFADLHDLVLDICRNLAGKDSRIQEFNASLIETYLDGVRHEMQEHSNRFNQSSFSEEEMCIFARIRGFLFNCLLCRHTVASQNRVVFRSNHSSCGHSSNSLPPSLTGTREQQFIDFKSLWLSVSDDSYIFKNICELLKNAGWINELMWLLFSPHWIVKQLLNNGEQHVAADIQVGLDCSGDGFNGTERQMTTKFFNYLRKAVHLSVPAVNNSNWDDMAWFQLYGRLLIASVKNRRVEDFVQEIRLHAPKPWARPSVGCLPAASGSLREVFGLDGVPILCRDFDHTLVICYSDSTDSDNKLFLKFIDSKSASQKTKFLRSNDYGWAVGAISETGDTLSVRNNDNNNVIIWRKEIVHSVDLLSSSLQWREVGVLEGHTEEVHSIGLHKDGYLAVTGSLDKMVRVWEDRGGIWREVGVLEGHTDLVSSVCVCRNGLRVVSGSWDMTVRVWEAENGLWAEVAVLEGHTNEVNSIGVSEDGCRLVSGADDETVRVWEELDGSWREMGVLQGHTALVYSVAVSIDGSLVVSGSWDRTVRVWEAGDGSWRKVAVLEGHTTGVYTVGLSADGRRVVSGAQDKTVRMWEAEDGSWGELAGLEGHTEKVNSVCVSRDGCRVVSGSDDKTVRIWEAAQGSWREVAILEGHNNWVYSVGVSGDGYRVVSGSWDKTVRIWEAVDGLWREIGVLEGHTALVSSVAMSENGCHVLSGSWDKTVRLWEARGGSWREVAVLQGHTDRVYRVGVSGDGRQVVSGSWDKTGRVWEEGPDGRWITVRLLANWSPVSGDDLFEDGIGNMAAINKRVRCSEEAKSDFLHAVEAEETYKTRSGYAVCIKRRPYLIFVDVEN